MSRRSTATATAGEDLALERLQRHLRFLGLTHTLAELDPAALNAVPEGVWHWPTRTPTWPSRIR